MLGGLLLELLLEVVELGLRGGEVEGPLLGAVLGAGDVEGAPNTTPPRGGLRLPAPTIPAARGGHGMQEPRGPGAVGRGALAAGDVGVGDEAGVAAGGVGWMQEAREAGAGAGVGGREHHIVYLVGVHGLLGGRESGVHEDGFRRVVEVECRRRL